jgi:hypothetical protein
MDTWDLAIKSYLKTIDVKSAFRDVNETDYEEVAQRVFLEANKIENGTNVSIFPENKKRDYDKLVKNSVYQNVDISMRCKSGNVYFVGFNI